MTDYHDFIRDLLINAAALLILIHPLYFRRHGDRETAIMLAMFNLFLFTIVIAVTLTNISIAAGFALFAVLSIVTLRSVNIDRIDVGYLFGAIALALINGISIPDYTLLALCNVVILGTALIVDSPWLIRPALKIELTLDQVSLADATNNAVLQQRLEQECESPVRHVRLTRYDSNKKTARLVAYIDLDRS